LTAARQLLGVQLKQAVSTTTATLATLTAAKATSGSTAQGGKLSIRSARKPQKKTQVDMMTEALALRKLETESKISKNRLLAKKHETELLFAHQNVQIAQRTAAFMEHNAQLQFTKQFMLARQKFLRSGIPKEDVDTVCPLTTITNTLSSTVTTSTTTAAYQPTLSSEDDATSALDIDEEVESIKL